MFDAKELLNTLIGGQAGAPAQVILAPRSNAESRFRLRLRLRPRPRCPALLAKQAGIKLEEDKASEGPVQAGS